MDPIVYDETPLAEYLKDGGGGSEVEWAAATDSPDRNSTSESDVSLPPSPTPFAPSGRPCVRTGMRRNLPKALRLDSSNPTSLHSLRKNCSAAVAASIDRADNARFLEQFRYTIVASQLLNEQSLLGSHHPHHPATEAVTSTVDPDQSIVSIGGIITCVLGALVTSVVLTWLLGSRTPRITIARLSLLLVLLAVTFLLGQIYLRQQWLHYRREQALSEIRSFVENSRLLDVTMGAALGLIHEVELVSRGYRLTTPLPPVSRMEDRTQMRRCTRIRTTLRRTTVQTLESYKQVLQVVRGFSEQTNLDKYYDIYDISGFDIQDALEDCNEGNVDDRESLRMLKIFAARLHIIRKLLLCALLALEANGESADLLRWTAAVEALRSVGIATRSACQKLDDVLNEEEPFPILPSPKIPLTPNKERWRSQLRKLNSLSTGIRGLQAKLQLLREESDRTLNDSQDLSELGPSLMSQYESIGGDLKELMIVWEEGKTALAQGIDRNERRLSSMSTMSTLLSPTSSLGGLTTVEEGTADDAYKALVGYSPSGSEISPEPGNTEVFEAVATPRPRSTLTREERMAKMREGREHKAQARQQVDATRGMLKELEAVINLRPNSRLPQTPTSPGRIVSV